MGLDKQSGVALIRDNETLRHAFEHLWYEIWMMRSTADLLASGNFAQGTVESNAFLEAFVIHARNLTHFFSPQHFREDDVVVGHFIDARLIGEEIKQVIDEDFFAARARAGKEIAHLTYKRAGIKHSNKGWNVVKLAGKLSTLVGFFLDIVDSDKISQGLKEKKYSGHCTVKEGAIQQEFVRSTLASLASLV